MRLIRVFPRRTKATPDDNLVRINITPAWFDEADKVHISVTFTDDIEKAEYLYDQWKYVANTKIGGCAMGERSGEFIPGKYLKQGYVITSRGCPNRCWFCDSWKREGDVRELEIKDGWNVLDDNLLACSDNHIRSVFDMLNGQQEKAEFTGGLEARRLKQWHCEELYSLRPKQIFFAYDTPDDYDPLVEAGLILRDAGFKPLQKDHTLRCYVLCGYPKDTFEDAERRLKQTIDAGFMPMAMVWSGNSDPTWRSWRRKWSRPAIIHARILRDR